MFKRIYVMSGNKYITKKSLNSDFFLTDNKNFAYSFDNTEEAEDFISCYNNQFPNLKIKEV